MTNAWAPEFTRKDLEIIEEKEVYSGYSPVKAYQLRFRLFNGEWSIPVRREILIRPQAAAVLLYDPENDKVILIEQMRMGVIDEKSPWVLDIVAGVVDLGETTEQTAIREAKEEAGAEIETLIPICSYLVSVGISNERTTVYCGLVKAPEFPEKFFGNTDEGEDIKVHIVSTTTAIQWFKEGKIRAASAVIALQWLMLNEGLRSFR